MTIKKPITLRAIFENKKISMIISLVLAITLWLVITITESPDSENTLTGLSVSIPIENTVVSEMGMDIIGDPNAYTTSVTVRGPAYVVSDVTADDISVSASISNVTNSGIYTLELRAIKQAGADDNFEIISLSPKTINVEFDYIDTKQFELYAQAIGHKVEDGLMAELPFISNKNNAVLNVKGPRTDIEKISKIVAVAEVNKTLRRTETFTGSLKIFDTNGNEMKSDGLTITAVDGVSAPDIKVTVPIYKEKEVPIVAQFINQPKGFLNRKFPHRLEYSSMLVSGPPEVIDKITECKLSEIDFRQITGNNQKFKTSLIIPEGVKNKDNIETVTVTIDGLENYSVKTFDITKISVIDAVTVTNVRLTRAIRNVKIIGPKEVIDRINSKDLYAEIETQGLQSGEHTVSVNVACKTANTVWQIGEYTATVNIS